MFGSLISGIGSFLGGERANIANAKQAKEQMAFQERMSSTSHQRQVKDLKAAGLNPILSANTGASTPSGASAQINDSITPALSSALQYKMTRSQIENLAASVEKTQEDTRLSKDLQKTAQADSINKLANAKAADAIANANNQQAKNLQIEGLLKSSTVMASKNQEDYQKGINSLPSWLRNLGYGARDLIATIRGGNTILPKSPTVINQNYHN